MSDEMSAAILTGIVIFAGIALEQWHARRQQNKQRRAALVSGLLGQLLSGLHEDTNAKRAFGLGTSKVDGDTAALELARAELSATREMLSAKAQLLAFGGTRVREALLAYEDAPLHTGDCAMQTAVVELFNAVRQELLREKKPIPASDVRKILFG